MSLRHILWAGFFLACDRPPVIVQHRDRRILLEGVRIDRYERDRRSDRASIGRAYLDRSSGEVIGEGISAQSLDADGERATLESKGLRSDLETRIADFIGGVVLRDRSGRTLRSETLRYDSKRDEIETSAPIVLEGPGFSARGGRLTGQPRAGRLLVDGPTSAEIQPGGRRFRRSDLRRR